MILNKKVVKLPSTLVTVALFVLKRLKLSQYGEEQVRFLKYRPVLDNKKLKEEFGYIPMKTSIEVFKYYLVSKVGNADIIERPASQN